METMGFIFGMMGMSFGLMGFLSGTAAANSAKTAEEKIDDLTRRLSEAGVLDHPDSSE